MIEKNMTMIHELSENKAQVCEDILRSLPEWFGIEEAVKNYIEEVRTRPVFVAREKGMTAGFLSLTLHNKFTGEIHVMGVKREFHRKGVGKGLVAHAEVYLSERGFKFLTVKTLSSSRESSEYEKTRKFYLALGFAPLEEFKTLWGEANPCLFLAKAISAAEKVQ